jgi:hypothetical protein
VAFVIVRNRQVRAEVSQCQRWIELRIGEWLGPANPGDRTDLTSLPGNKVEINPRHKQEFRFIAEYKGIVTDIMKNNPGKEITRAMLIAAMLSPAMEQPYLTCELTSGLPVMCVTSRNARLLAAHTGSR